MKGNMRPLFIHFFVKAALALRFSMSMFLFGGSVAKNRLQRFSSHPSFWMQQMFYLLRSDTSSIRNLMTILNKDIPDLLDCRMSKGPQMLDPKATPLVYNAYVKDTHFLSFNGCHCTGTWLWIMTHPFSLALSMFKCSAEIAEMRYALWTDANLQHDCDPAGCSSKVRGGVGWRFSKVVEIHFGSAEVSGFQSQKKAVQKGDGRLESWYILWSIGDSGTHRGDIFRKQK
jgi:hypothetical protein